MLIICLYIILCAAGFITILIAAKKHEQKNIAIRKEKLTEVFEKLQEIKTIPKLSQTQTESGIFFDYNKKIYCIGYYPQRNEYLLFSYKPNAKNYELKLMAKNLDDILWFVEMLFDF